MSTFYTGRISGTGSVAGGIGIVWRSNHPFAPTEAMVKDFKSGKIDWNQYTERYLAKLQAEYRRNPSIFKNIREGEIFKCYCRPPHCHRFLLAEILQKCGHKYGGEK